MADHLARRAFDVTVVTGVPHYPQWRVDPAYRGRLRCRERRGAVDVRRMWHYVPQEQSALGRAIYELTFFVQAASAGDVPRPDCVIGVVPSLSGGAAAALMARRYRVPLGLLFQDLMGHAAAQSGMPGGGVAARPAAAIEAFTARRARRVAVVAEAFRPHLVALGVARENIDHVPNWSHVSPPRLPSDQVRRTLGWSSDRPVALHAGNMGFKQDLGNIIEAAGVAAERGSDVQFVLMGDGSERRRLETLAQGLRNVTFVDPQPKETFMDVLGAADVLLLNERESVVDMSLPSKITSYFAAGRPVVAAVPSGGSTRNLLAASGGAFLVEPGHPHELLRAVERVVADGHLSKSLVDRASTYAADNLEETTLLERVDAFVDALMADRPRAGGATASA